MCVLWPKTQSRLAQRPKFQPSLPNQVSCGLHFYGSCRQKTLCVVTWVRVSVNPNPKLSCSAGSGFRLFWVGFQVIGPGRILDTQLMRVVFFVSVITGFVHSLFACVWRISFHRETFSAASLHRFTFCSPFFRRRHFCYRYCSFLSYCVFSPY